MYCNECGSRVPADKKFCPKCGMKIDDSGAEVSSSPTGAFRPDVKRIEINKPSKLPLILEMIVVIVIGAGVVFAAFYFLNKKPDDSGNEENNTVAPIPITSEQENMIAKQQEAVLSAAKSFWDDVDLGNRRLYETPDPILPWKTTFWVSRYDNRVINTLREKWRKQLESKLADFDKLRNSYIQQWGTASFDKFVTEKSLTPPDPKILDRYKNPPLPREFSDEELLKMDDDIAEKRTDALQTCKSLIDSNNWKAIVRFCGPVRGKFQRTDIQSLSKLSMAYYYAGEYSNACEQLKNIEILYDQEAGEIPDESTRNKEKIFIETNTGTACREAGQYDIADRYFKLAQSLDQEIVENTLVRHNWAIYYEWAKLMEIWASRMASKDMDTDLQNFIMAHYSSALDWLNIAFDLFLSSGESDPLFEAMIATQTGAVRVLAAELKPSSKDKLRQIAKNDLEFALSNDPLAVEPYKWLGMLARQQDDKAAAISNFQKYYEKIVDPQERKEAAGWIEELGGKTPKIPQEGLAPDSKPAGGGSAP